MEWRWILEAALSFCDLEAEVPREWACVPGCAVNEFPGAAEQAAHTRVDIGAPFSHGLRWGRAVLPLQAPGAAPSNLFVAFGGSRWT